MFTKEVLFVHKIYDFSRKHALLGQKNPGKFRRLTFDSDFTPILMQKSLRRKLRRRGERRIVFGVEKQLGVYENQSANRGVDR